MIDLLLIVLPAFLIFGTGYIGQRMLKLNIKSISTMALYLMLPFLTFDTFYTNELNMNYLYMFVFTAGLALILIVVTLLVGKAAGADRPKMAAMLLGSLFPNSGNYGAPVVLFAFGATAFNYAVIIMVIHSLLVSSIGIFIASYGGGKSASHKQALSNIIKMPVLYGVFFGIVLQLMHLELPPTIIDGISLVGSASIPTVMLILGMQLAEIKPQKFEWKYVNAILFTRMAASPLIAAALVILMPVDELIKSVFVILAAMPVAANTTMLALQFDVEPDLISFTTLITTLVSLVTIPLTLYLL